MRITKFGHACVRIETGSTTVVLDPGGWSEREAVDGATAILVTHEHPDHFDVDHLRATSAPVWTIEAVARQITEQAPDVAERVSVVRPGDVLDVGVPVTVVGHKHAVIHPDLQHFDNSGYVLEVEGRRIFHPGDAVTEQPADVDLLCLPIHAPWSKMSEVIDYGRTVGAPLSLAVHDGLLNERGLGLIGRQVTALLGEREQEYLRLEPGQDLPIG